MPFKNEKTLEAMRRLAGEFFARESSGGGLITVTGGTLSGDRSKAVIFISILPPDKEKNALSFAKRKRSEFRDYAMKHVRMRVVPFIDFAIDVGEKNRRKIDELLRENIITRKAT